MQDLRPLTTCSRGSFWALMQEQDRMAESQEQRGTGTLRPLLWATNEATENRDSGSLVMLEESNVCRSCLARKRRVIIARAMGIQFAVIVDLTGRVVSRSLRSVVSDGTAVWYRIRWWVRKGVCFFLDRFYKRFQVRAVSFGFPFLASFSLSCPRSPWRFGGAPRRRRSPSSALLSVLFLCLSPFKGVAVVLGGVV